MIKKWMILIVFSIGMSFLSAQATEGLVNKPRDQFVTGWLETAIVDSMSFKSDGVSISSNDSHGYFSGQSYELFENYTKTPMLRVMKEKKYSFVTAIVTASPAILSSKMVDGLYVWNVQVPYQLIYTGGSKQQSEFFMGTTTVRQSMDQKNTYGLAIEDIKSIVSDENAPYTGKKETAPETSLSAQKEKE
ncbi:MAG: DotI/IcmL family type IV secretion protein [Alphaproteobacteria bacterium]|nr:DotI/IcmL family type IV secretion protein [Alphaproteobacteria bacterium]